MDPWQGSGPGSGTLGGYVIGGDGLAFSVRAFFLFFDVN